MLHLPRDHDQHFEVRKVLRLPRNLHIKVQPHLHLPRKSRLWTTCHESPTTSRLRTCVQHRSLRAVQKKSPSRTLDPFLLSPAQSHFERFRFLHAAQQSECEGRLLPTPRLNTSIQHPALTTVRTWCDHTVWVNMKPEGAHSKTKSP